MKNNSTYEAIKKADIKEFRKGFFLPSLDYLKKFEQTKPYTKFEDELTFIHNILLKENAYI